MAENEEKLEWEIMELARQNAAKLLLKAEQEAEAIRIEAALRRQAAEAERRASAERTIQDTIRSLRALREVEKRRYRLLARETTIRTVLDQARDKVRGLEGNDRLRSLTKLLEEAAGVLHAPALTIRMRPEDIALLGEKTLAAMALKSSGVATEGAVTVIPDPELDGGVCLETADGKRRFDNSTAARLNRLDGSLRTMIASELGFLHGPKT